MLYAVVHSLSQSFPSLRRTRGSTLQPAGVWIRPVRPWPPQSDENKKARPDRCLGSGRQGGWADGRLRKRTLSIWGAGSMLLMLFFLTCQVGTSRFYQSSFLSSFLPSLFPNSELQISVGTAGPQPWAPDQRECQNRMPDRMPATMSEYIPWWMLNRMSEWTNIHTHIHTYTHTHIHTHTYTHTHIDT